MNQAIIMKENEKIMKTIFPDWGQYPADRLIPAVAHYHDDKEPVVIHLLYKSDHAAKKLLKARNGKKAQESTTVDVSVGTSENKKGFGYDLALAFAFDLPDESLGMQALIPGDDPNDQQRFVEALKQIEHFYLWVIDTSGRLVRFMTITWNYEAHQEIWGELPGGSK